MKEKLNGFHVALLFYMIELDVTVFMLPRMVAVHIGTNGWLGFLGLALIVAFNIWLYRLVYRAGKGRSAFDIAEAVLPKFALFPVYGLLALLWLALGAFAGKSFVLVFQTLTFQTSSAMQIFAVYCLLVFMLLSKDLYSIIKASTVFFLLSIWMLALAPYFFKDWSYHRFTTFFFKGTENGFSFAGLLDVYAVFIGYELCFFLFPFSDAKTKLFKGVLAGHAIITSTYLLTIAISFGFFSFEEVKILQFPVIHTLEYIEIPFINRVENLVFPFFLYSNLVTTVLFAFAARSAIGRMLPRVEAKRFALPLAAVIFALGFLPSIFSEAAALIRLTYFTETGVAFALPLLLLLLLKIGGNASKEASGR